MADEEKNETKKEAAERPYVESAAEIKAGPKLKGVVTHRAFAAALLFLISFAVFIPSIHNGLVWDDIRYVITSADYYQSAEMSVDMLIPTAGGPGKYFRPVYTASLMMDHRIWGSAPFGFHLTSIVLHSVATVLLYFLVILIFREFGKDRGSEAAFLSGLFFALYPLHVESVSFIAARGDILAAMLFFLCMIFYLLSFRKHWLILLAGVFLYLSFVSKEVAYSFPIVILGFDVVSRRILNLRNLLKYIIVVIPVIIYFFIRFGGYSNFAATVSRPDVREVQGTVHAGEFLNIFFNTYLFYTKKLLFPYDLNSFIGTIPGGDALHLVFSVLLVVFVCIAFVISMKRKENITAFCLLWIFATLGPAVMIAIYPLAITRFAERFLYLPSAGYCLLVAYLIVKAAQRSGIKWAAWAAGGLLCISFAVVTIKGQGIWKDNLSFWENAVRKSPDQMAPKINYGASLRSAGRVDEAIIQYSRALSPRFDSSKSGKAIAAFGLGVSYMDKGDYVNAERFFKVALEYNPESAAQYHHYMGFISLRKNDVVSAEKHLRKSLDLSPLSAKTHYLLGVAYFVEAGRANSARKYRLAENSLERTLEISPGYTKARILLARVYLALGERDKARRQAGIALETARDAGEVSQAKSILNMN